MWIPDGKCQGAIKTTGFLSDVPGFNTERAFTKHTSCNLSGPQLLHLQNEENNASSTAFHENTFMLQVITYISSLLLREEHFLRTCSAVSP